MWNVECILVTWVIFNGQAQRKAKKHPLLLLNFQFTQADRYTDILFQTREREVCVHCVCVYYLYILRNLNFAFWLRLSWSSRALRHVLFTAVPLHTGPSFSEAMRNLEWCVQFLCSLAALGFPLCDSVSCQYSFFCSFPPHLERQYLLGSPLGSLLGSRIPYHAKKHSSLHLPPDIYYTLLYQCYFFPLFFL